MQQWGTISQSDCDLRRLWCAMKSGFIWQLETTSSVAGLRSSKALPKAKVAPKKSWSLFGSLLLIWSLQLSESWGNYYIQEVCLANWWDALKTAMPASQHWSTERAHFTQSHVAQLVLQKLNGLGYRILPYLPYSWPLTNHFLRGSQQLFARKMLPPPARGRKCFPYVHWIPRHGFSCYRNKQTYFLLAKVCWL